jgi:AcrR family transcriptional regulator
VADMAGYSYATIYNYFNDINHMMREVKAVMVMELFETLQKKLQRTAYDLEELKKGLRIYIEYYFENPNIFKFFYFYPFGRPSDESEASDSGIDFGSTWSEAFKGLVQQGRIREQDIEIVAKTLIYSIHGLITLCLSSNGDLMEEKVYEELEKIVDFILLKK